MVPNDLARQTPSENMLGLTHAAQGSPVTFRWREGKGGVLPPCLTSELTGDHYRIGQSLVICHAGVLSIRTTKLCTDI